MLHRGVDAVYLLVYSWVWDNVPHCQTASAGSSFLGSVDGTLTEFHEVHRPWTAACGSCPPLTFEPAAWVPAHADPGYPTYPGISPTRRSPASSGLDDNTMAEQALTRPESPKDVIRVMPAGVALHPIGVGTVAAHPAVRRAHQN